MEVTVGKNYDWFIYTHTAVALAASATATGTATIQIAADAPFQIQFLTLSVQGTASGLILTNFGGLMDIDITQSGRKLSNIAIPCNAINLAGLDPYQLNPFRLIPSNSSVVVTFTNSAAATATTLQLCLHGNKVRATTSA